jgi:hypothetical protein
MWRGMAPELSFPWVVSDAGHEWRGGQSSRAVLCERNIPGASGWVYHPLLEYPALFREFAELQGLNQIRKFADQYGVLFSDYSDVDHVLERGRYWSVGAAHGTSLNVWAQEIGDITFLVDIWDSIEAGRVSKLRDLISWKKGGVVEYLFVTPTRSSWKLLAPAGRSHPFKEGEVLNPARHLLQQEINERLSGGHSSGISYAPRLLRRSDGTLHLFLRPRNLLSAIWLQFAQVVGGCYELRQCPICERYFLPKRSDAKTCNDACRQKKSRNDRRDNQ